MNILIAVTWLSTILHPQISPLEVSTWHDTYIEAKAAAEEKELPLLIAFLGPNWCPFSDQLESEVLSSDAFLKNLEGKVVFLKVDIPEDFDEGSYPGLALKQKYKVDECPALVLANPTGEEIAKLQYLPIECGEFATYIRGMLSDYEKMHQFASKSQLKKLSNEELQSLYAKAGRLADTTFKKALLEQGLKTDKSPYFLLEEYGNLLTKRKLRGNKLKNLKSKIIARDPNNEEGCQRKLALMDFEALASIKKPQNAEVVVRPLVEYLQAFGKKDFENAWQIEMKISQYFFAQNRIEDALRHAQASLEKAPDSAKKEIAQSIEYLENYVR